MKHMGPTTGSGNTWSQFAHEVGLGVAVRVMPVPSVNSPPQREPQLIPAGALETVVSLILPCFTTNNSVDVGEEHDTVSRVWATTPWYSAEMVVVPQETVVASPASPGLLIVAMATLLD